MEFSSFVFIFIFLFVISALWLSINIVPQSQNWVIESLGKYNRTLNAGFQLGQPVGIAFWRFSEFDRLVAHDFGLLATFTAGALAVIFV